LSVAAPFTIYKDGNICFLELDTPGSSVNIFNRAAADQVERFIGQIKPNDASLIVFKSAKPYSFLNGTELVLTANAHTAEDAAVLSGQTRRAYKTIERCPVPTVSAIQGSCFGCGVEFALCTDYRLAADSFDTCFYMTEMRDYYFPPIFGAVEKLPRLLGLSGAADFLLWGEKWRAQQARHRNLIDHVLPAEHFDSNLRAFLGSGALRNPSKRPILERRAPDSDGEMAERDPIRHRIGRLPAEQRDLYTLCFEAMIESLRSPYSSEFFRKSNEAFQSVFRSDAWRNATSFFFIRTMARTASLGTSSLIPSERVTLRLPAAGPEFARVFGGRALKGLTVHRDDAIGVPELIDENAIRHPFAVRWGYADDVRPGRSPLIYFPDGERCDVCEVFIEPGSLSRFRSLLVLITHLGWHPIVRGMSGKSVLNTLIDAGPSGFGHVHREACQLLSAKALRHSSQVDVAVCSLFDFPVSRGSFMSHMAETS
jgi:enoyl-CoA hydratase/carnithine racemase